MFMQTCVVLAIVLALCVMGAVIIIGLILNHIERRTKAKIDFKKAKQALKNKDDLYPKVSDIDKICQLRDNGWSLKAYRRYPGGTVKFNSGIFYKDNCKNTLVTFGEDNKLKEKEEKDE